jgi:hypothetical protein
MNTYLVGYDLNKPRGADDYEKLREALRQHSGYWWSYLDSTFIIKSNYSAMQIAEALKSYLDSGDELLVVGLTGEWASLGFTDEANKWLRENMSNAPSYVGYRYF